MTKKELSLNTKWDEFEMGICLVFFEVLNQYIPIIFFQEHKPTPAISDKMLQSLNTLLDIPLEIFENLKQIVGTTFYEQSKIKEIHIDQDNDTFESVYAEVIMEAKDKSLISIIVKDGQFLCINDGSYFETL